MKEETYAARTEANPSRPGSARARTAGSRNTRQPVPGGDQLAHRAAGAGVQAVPDQHDRAAELLVRGIQEPGVIRLGETLALIAPAGAVGAVDQPAAGSPGRTAISAASDTRVSWPQRERRRIVRADQPARRCRTGGRS